MDSITFPAHGATPQRASCLPEENSARPAWSLFCLCDGGFDDTAGVLSTEREPAVGGRGTLNFMSKGKGGKRFAETVSEV